MADRVVFSNGNNHSFDTAQELHINEIVYGNMTSVDIDDYYKIHFNGSGTMQFLLKINKNTRYNMYIYEEGNYTTHIAHMGGNLGSERKIIRPVENKTYYIRVYAYNADSIDHNTAGYDYNLQFIPTVATGISLNFSDNQYIRTSSVDLEYTTTPSNAYVQCIFQSCDSAVTVNDNNTLQASKDAATIVTVTDLYNGESDSKLVIFELHSAPYNVAIPTNRRCNWNQKHSGVTNLFGGSACTLVAGLDVANIYATNSTGYTPSDMVNYWTEDGKFTWQIPGPGRIKPYYYVTTPSNVASSLAAEYVRQNYICYIKNEIYNGRPVIINLGSDVNHNHSVVAYKYLSTSAVSQNETPTEMDRIQVFDPENGGNNTDIGGRDVTLWEAYRYNYSATLTSDFIIWSLRPTAPQ